MNAAEAREARAKKLAQRRAEAREARAKKLAQRRVDERACALDFLTWGDEQGVHAKRCVYSKKRESIHRAGKAAGNPPPVCSRDYNPGPKPDDEKLYRGTGIGTLFGLSTINAWQLAGWNITRRKDAA